MCLLAVFCVILRSGASHRKDSVKLDFEKMRIEKSYHRADLRRLSTESFVKEQGTSLGTRWLWYRKEESGEWTEYGEKVRQKPFQLNEKFRYKLLNGRLDWCGQIAPKCFGALNNFNFI